MRSTLAAPASTVILCLDAKGAFCIHPIGAVSLGAWDLTHGSALKSFQLSGLFEVPLVPGTLGLAVGGGFQGGDIPGLALHQLLSSSSLMASAPGSRRSSSGARRRW